METEAEPVKKRKAEALEDVAAAADADADSDAASLHRVPSTHPPAPRLPPVPLRASSALVIACAHTRAT